jgi:hypothetical protein
MRFVVPAVIVVFALAETVMAGQPHQSIQSVPPGTRASYGTDFGNRYQYFGLGYGYGPGAFGPGGWSGYSGRSGGSGGYGRSSSYGGYGGRYGNPDQQLQALHQEQMMWTGNFAPMPQTAPGVTVNPAWNPYQNRLSDDIFRRSEPPIESKTIENPFTRHAK